MHDVAAEAQKHISYHFLFKFSDKNRLLVGTRYSWLVCFGAAYHPWHTAAHHYTRHQPTMFPHVAKRTMKSNLTISKVQINKI